MGKLTKPQAAALRLWAEHGPCHQKMIGVRDDVYCRLWDAGYLRSAGLLVKKISDKGIAALSEYDAKERRK